MTDTTTVVAVPAEPVSTSTIDWGAVIGGALIAAALWLVLFAFGAGAGVAAVSPYSWDNPSGTTLTIIGVAWFCVITIGSYMVGGYFAGRFRRPGAEGTVEEREQRDGAHGLVVWAVAMLVGVAVASSLAAGAARTAATAAGGAAGGAAAVAAQSAPQNGVAGIVDTMLRPPAGENAEPIQRENPGAEIARILSASLAQGQITNENRDYVARIVAAETKMPPEEARKRVDAAIEQARQTVETARRITVALAFLIGAISVISAGGAYWAATAGGRLRDEALIGGRRVVR